MLCLKKNRLHAAYSRKYYIVYIPTLLMYFMFYYLLCPPPPACVAVVCGRVEQQDLVVMCYHVLFHMYLVEDSDRVIRLNFGIVVQRASEADSQGCSIEISCR